MEEDDGGTAYNDAMLDNQLQALIRDEVPRAIEQKRLTPVLLDLVYRRNWFNLWVPKDYGGLGYDLSGGCRLLEELAYVDGGFGWTVTLCAGANMFAGYIDPVVASLIFADEKVCWGGSGKPSGRAERVGDGFVLSGTWKYATGAPHLTHFTLNAWLYEEGMPVVDTDGEPVYRSFFVGRDQVLIHYDWDTFGLECTASHSFSLSDIYVPENHAFDLQPDNRTHDDLLYRYPFMTFAECTLAVNYIGMFRRFLDLFERLLFLKSADPIWAKERGKELFRLVDAKRTTFEQQHRRLYSLMEKTWGSAAPEEALLTEVAMLTRTLVRAIKMDTVELFPFAGIAGAQRDNELNIVFRHIFTASQHALLNT